MLEGLRKRIAELLRLGADSLVGPGLPSARAEDGDGWNLISGGDGPADRDWTAIREDLSDSLEAWRRNAWVRQIVRLMTAYVVGDGIQVGSERPSVERWVTKFYEHPQNQMASRLPAWCDELCRAGEIFVALFPNQADGMQYVRAIPAQQIQRVETDPEDYEKETGYYELVPGQVEPRYWASQHTAGADEPCLLHFAVNKPVGATRGESDLTPLLPWATRYTGWLKDRVTYNKIRTELATAEIIIDDDSQVQAKREQYKASPPTTGSLYIHGRGEELKFPAANITAFEAKDDGQALRLAMAAAGDVPLHFFSEGDSATRATAVEMGDPTHRFYRQRQRELGGFVVDLCEVAYRRHLAILRGIKEKGLGSWRRIGDLGLEYQATDISRADNKALAEAARTIVEAFARMKEQGWITDELAIRTAFRFAGEVLSDEEIDEILRQAQDDEGRRTKDEGELNANGKLDARDRNWERLDALLDTVAASSDEQLREFIQWQRNEWLRRTGSS